MPGIRSQVLAILHNKASFYQRAMNCNPIGMPSLKPAGTDTPGIPVKLASVAKAMDRTVILALDMP